MDEGGATTGDDALLDRCTSRGDSILDAVLLLVELDLGGRTHANDTHTAGELGNTLLELLAVPFGVGVVVLSTQLGDASLDVGLDGHRVEGAADLVDDEGTQGLPVDVLGHDEQVAVGGDDLLQQREQVVHRRDLAGVDEDVRILDHGLHAVLVGDHVGRQVALVELHALGEVELGAEGLGLVDGDDAVLANLVESLGDELTDLLVTAGDSGDTGHVRGGVDGARDRAKLLHDGVDGLLDTVLETDRVAPGGHGAQSLVNEGLGEHGGGGGSITGHVVGLGGDLLASWAPRFS